MTCPQHKSAYIMGCSLCSDVSHYHLMYFEFAEKPPEKDLILRRLDSIERMLEFLCIPVYSKNESDL